MGTLGVVAFKANHGIPPILSFFYYTSPAGKGQRRGPASSRFWLTNPSFVYKIKPTDSG